MNIQFVGSGSSYHTFKVAMMDKVKITMSETDANARIYEVSSIEDLYKIPKTFKLPVFFYITTKDKNVSSRIREYPIKGIIFPPLNPEAIMAKLRCMPDGDSVEQNSDEYDSIKIKILAKAENIPPLPALAQQLICLTRSNSATIADVTAKIKMDQGISSRVIKLINSPFYGMRQEVTSIDRATVLLGFNSVKNIAAAISLGQFYNKPFNLYKTTGKNLWGHSYKTACVAQLIGKLTGQDEDSLYLAGLLHDIGKIVMVDFLVKEASFPEDEKAQLGFDHCEIGAIILRKWSVAGTIAEAVKNHHNVSASPMARTIYYANRIDSQHESAESTIEEMAFTMNLQNIDVFKNKIIPFITEFNGEI